MVDFIPSERGTPIRYPSTANLMIDSADRDDKAFSSPWDFSITRNYSIMNGFFTRIGATEVVLEWCKDNISFDLSNNWVKVDISGGGANTTNLSNVVISIPSGIYNVAQTMDAIVAVLNDISGSTGGMVWGVTTNFGDARIQVINNQIGYINILEEGLLYDQLDISTGGALEPYASVFCADLRPYRYLDFVSSQLTYNQDLKDNSTSKNVRDVLVRWYFTEDSPEPLDKYGFPVLMGYTRFVRRRLYNPPKQIKWQPNQPMGNLSFQVYGDDGDLVTADLLDSNWLMTLQLSEV